ncbi:hypothetical protein SRABI96_01984 [Peribacillus sp. Bi96]|nr:hypothetical protein SRABI96_01984 [Peribacillus sp. Bi96]
MPTVQLINLLMGILFQTDSFFLSYLYDAAISCTNFERMKLKFVLIIYDCERTKDSNAQ